MCVFPFIIPDVIKLGIAVAAVKTLPNRIKALRF
jgi:biotin transporter BioY